MSSRHLAVVFCGLSLSCGPASEPPSPPTSQVPSSEHDIYNDDHVLRVSIALPDAEWNTLRTQARHTLDVLGDTCHVSAADSPYTYVRGDVVVDGVVLTDVGIRKKGFFGTLSETRPSLKIKLDAYIEGQHLFGLKRLTLNNNLSDTSQLRQCLGYLITEAAGLPAPRCTLASVAVNGQELGLYTNVEPIKKPFLRRHFDDDEGNLYEGAFSDFRPGWVNAFERKTNKSGSDRSDLEAVVDALALDDDQAIDALSDHIDLDRFYTYWALEILFLHIDGYSRSTNNFFLYRDPTLDRFVFFPWGIDVILQEDRAWFLDEELPPPATWANGALAKRLYDLPEGRMALAARLQLLLDDVWLEKTWLDEVDRLSEVMEPLVASASEPEQELIEASVQEVREFIVGRRATLEAALVSLPSWERSLPPSLCLDVVGSTTISISDDGSATVDLALGEVVLEGMVTQADVATDTTILLLEELPGTIELDSAALRLGPGPAARGRLLQDGAVVAVFGHSSSSEAEGALVVSANLYPHP